MKNIVKISAVFLGAMLFTGRVSGQTRLADLINYALEHSTEIKKANLQVEENSYMRNGWVLIGGLSSSMVLSFLVVPVIYVTLDSVVKRFRKHI